MKEGIEELTFKPNSTYIFLLKSKESRIKAPTAMATGHTTPAGQTVSKEFVRIKYTLSSENV